MNKTLQDISGRRSVRKFKPEPISEDELNIILEAGKAAPSSLNRQPWYFTVVQNKELLNRIVEANKEIVKASPELMKMAQWINAPNYNNFYGAPTVIFISGENGNHWRVCDCALAMENMALAAQSINIGTCIIASTRFIFESDKASEYMAELKIPEGYAPIFALSVGYIDGEIPGATPRKEDFVNYIR